MTLSIQQLADLLNQLRCEFPATPVLCIPWLHLKHPTHPIQEMFMRGEDRPEWPDAEPSGGWAARLNRRISERGSWRLRALFCLGNAFRLAVKIARLRHSHRRELHVLKGMQFDVIAKTWAFGRGTPPPNQDFYYGDLYRRLENRKVRALILCGDAANGNWKAFAASHFSAEPPFRIPELLLCSPVSPLKSAVNQIRASIELSRSARQTGDPQSAKIRMQASLDCLAPAVTQDSLFFAIAEASVRQWNPRAFVTLYEGHGWEKAAWWGAKSASRECRTVGYQHTVLFPEALSMLHPFIDVRERSVPDVVLALGEETAEILGGSHSRHGVQVVRFGTFRRPQMQAATSADPMRRTVLVLPEGIARETGVLFRFACECARAMPSHRFVLRAHPQWPASKALARIPESLTSLQNVEVSSVAGIDDDFKRASALLYRGSSSSLYGILSGLLAVHVQLPEMLNSDPVYQLTAWREVCRTPLEFSAVMQRHESRPDPIRDAEWRTAAAYVNRYVVPVDDGGIDLFLDAIGMDGRHKLCTA